MKKFVYRCGGPTWLAPLATILGGTFLGLFIGNKLASAPLSDGPRHIRHYLESFGPCLVATLFIDRFPPLSTVLPRERSVRWLKIGVFWIGSALQICTSLIMAPPNTEVWQYEIFISLLLASFALSAVYLWGAGGILASCCLALVWLMAGDSIAELLNFSIDSPSHSYFPTTCKVEYFVIAGLIAFQSTLFVGFSRRHK